MRVVPFGWSGYGFAGRDETGWQSFDEYFDPVDGDGYNERFYFEG